LSLLHHNVFSKGIRQNKVDFKPQIYTTLITTFCVCKILHIESPPKRSYIYTNFPKYQLWDCGVAVAKTTHQL